MSASRVPTHTEADFDHLSWHDCHVWGFDLQPGHPNDGDWASDLAFDIDYIVEWVWGEDGGATFKVVPASLVFHGVTDPKIEIDWGHSGLYVAVHAASFDRLERARVTDQKVHLDRPYYRWTIRLNWPSGGCFEFGAVGFTQTLRAEPILSEQQCLSRSQRQQLTAGISAAKSSEETDV